MVVILGLVSGVVSASSSQGVLGWEPSLNQEHYCANGESLGHAEEIRRLNQTILETNDAFKIAQTNHDTWRVNYLREVIKMLRVRQADLLACLNGH